MPRCLRQIAYCCMLVFASVLGVVPVLGTYWACLPAILDLWLMQDSKVRAIALFLAQIFPTAVVETTVYNEIKGCVCNAYKFFVN